MMKSSGDPLIALAKAHALNHGKSKWRMKSKLVLDLVAALNIGTPTLKSVLLLALLLGLKTKSTISTHALSLVLRTNT